MPSADATDATTAPPHRPLAGIRVLDLTQYLSGPVCTRLLVELGADVIKLEAPPYGDPQRGGHPRVNKRSGTFVAQNRGKRSICVDMGTAEGLDIVRRLVATVDIVVENYSVGVMRSRGLDYESLRDINPRIILASISGFGQSGPLAERPAFDAVIQAYSGLMHMTGQADGPPMLAGLPIADTNAGVHAFAAIGYALLARTSSGQGCHIDISMTDALFHQHEIPVYARSLDPEYQAVRSGAHHPTQSPAGAFRGPEGWIAIFCTQAQISRLWQALGRPDLADDDRFAQAPGRVAHRDVITALIEDWMSTFETDAEVVDALSAARVPCAPVVDPSRAMEHEHLRERGTVVEVVDERIGPITLPGPALRFSGMTTGITEGAPRLGEHNVEVLSGLLGLDESEIAELQAAGILLARPT